MISFRYLNSKEAVIRNMSLGGSNLLVGRISRPASYHPSKEKSKGILSQTKEYADAASIHGIKYIAEDGRHPIER